MEFSENSRGVKGMLKNQVKNTKGLKVIEEEGIAEVLKKCMTTDNKRGER